METVQATAEERKKSGDGPLRVVVVGSGLAGLTTAYLLRRRGCEVWVVEKSDKIGFHSASVEITPKWTVDVPMRSFQGGYYPQLISLYRHLGLELVPTYYTFSFSSFTSTCYFIYSGHNGLSTPSLPSRSSFLFGIIRFIHYTLCYILLLILSFVSWHYPLGYTLGTFNTRWFGINKFVEGVLVPIFSSVGTMTREDVLRTPLPVILEYIHATVGTPHYSLKGGAGRVAIKLISPIERQGKGYVRLGEEITLRGTSRIDTIRDKDGGGNGDGDGGEEKVVVGFKNGEKVVVDRVVLATQASAARTILKSLKPTLSSSEQNRIKVMLGGLDQVEYRNITVTTHKDFSVLPSQSDIRDINFRIPRGSNGYTMATHVITSQEGKEEGTNTVVLQSTNPIVPIDPALVLGTAHLERALSLRNPTTLSRLHPGDGLIHLAGSYAHPGIPLLEGCVGSARRAADAIVKDIDWNEEASFLGRLWRYRR